MQWAVCYFQNINLAEEEMVDQCITCYVARGVKLTKPRNKHQPVESHYPLFGQIVFIDYEPKIYNRVLQIRGFRRFLLVNKEVGLCKKGEVESIQEAEERGEFHYKYSENKPNDSFNIGDTVEIVENNTLEGSGIITKMDNTTLQVLLPGWSYPITVTSCQVRRNTLY